MDNGTSKASANDGESGRQRFAPIHTIIKTASITLNMVIDHLGSCEIMHRPKSARSLYRWAVAVSDKNVPKEDSYGGNLIFICKEDDALHFIEHSDPAPSSLIVILAEDGVPSWLPDSAWLNRSIVIRQSQSYTYYAKLIQGLFLTTWIWETEMDRIIHLEGGKGARGKLQKLIETSSSVIDAFLCVTDTGFNLIAHSTQVQVPNEVYRNLVESGCYDKREIERLERAVIPKACPQRKIVVSGADDRNPNTTLHMPLYIDGAYVFHFTMVVPQGGNVDTLTDVFTMFMQRAALICNNFWRNRAEVESPYHKALIGLIDGKKMSQEYLETQLGLTEIPRAKLFRLLRYQLDPKLPYLKSRNILQSARMLNDGRCCPFVYDDDLLILCYSPTPDTAGASLNKAIASTSATMLAPYGIPAFASQAFSDIMDLPLAYKQTAAALGAREQLMRAYPQGYDGDGAFPVFPFEHSMQFCIMNGTLEEDLIEFSFRNSILASLLKADREEGTSFVPLLWEYLCLESNANAVSKKLNIHRNTVMYHIGKFEKRYDVQLDCVMTRHRMLLDFTYCFSRSLC